MAETSLAQIVRGSQPIRLRQSFVATALADWEDFSARVQVRIDESYQRRGRVRLIHEAAEPRVKSSLRQKFIVATIFDDPSPLEHENLIGVTNC